MQDQACHCHGKLEGRALCAAKQETNTSACIPKCYKICINPLKDEEEGDQTEYDGIDGGEGPTAEEPGLETRGGEGEADCGLG